MSTVVNLKSNVWDLTAGTIVKLASRAGNNVGSTSQSYTVPANRFFVGGFVLSFYSLSGMAGQLSIDVNGTQIASIDGTGNQSVLSGNVYAGPGAVITATVTSGSSLNPSGTIKAMFEGGLHYVSP